MEAVQELFRKAWPDREPPDIVHCYGMALRIENVSRRGAHGQKKPASEPKLTAAGRKFLRELETVKGKREAMLQSFDLLSPVAVQAIGPDPLLEHMEQALTHVGAVLDAFKATKLTPARYIAEGAKETWRLAGVKVSKSPKAEDALCRFTTSTLTKCGIHYGPDHVSDMLRERTDRPRSGKAKKEGGRKNDQKLPD
jgi:hypothetical protein